MPILPKERDPRPITVRRGGTLTDEHHRLLADWALLCAEHMLKLGLPRLWRDLPDMAPWWTWETFRHGDDWQLPRDTFVARQARMIRNVVVGRLRRAEDPGQQAADAALLQQGLAGIAALTIPGMLAMSVGCDLGLRDGGWSFAITNDWEDAEAYRAYDADEEHNRLRREVFAKICEDIARVQFHVDR